MNKCNITGIGIMACALAKVALCADAISLSGKVTNLYDSALLGMKVTLKKQGVSTSTDSLGTWKINRSVASIKGNPRTTRYIQSNLSILDGRLVVNIHGVNQLGQMLHRAEPLHSSINPPMARSSSASEPDSLLYSWNGVVYARTEIPSITIGDAGTQRIDTNKTIPGLHPIWNKNIRYKYFVDSRDGQRYAYIKIGNQTWMAENLNFWIDTVIRPAPLGLASSNKSGSWCPNGDNDSCIKYGRLYHWSDVMDTSTGYNVVYLVTSPPTRGVCPIGWHMPIDSEFITLINFTGSTNLAGVLRAKSGWPTGSTIATDTFGFRGLPAGAQYGYDQSSYPDFGNCTEFWTASQYSKDSQYWDYANYASLCGFADGGISVKMYKKKFGFSVRCIMNQ